MDAAVTGRVDRFPPWPGEFVDAAGTSIFVRSAPASSAAAGTAVFLHGLGGGSTGWTDLMALLRDRLNGHAPDFPGFGRSQPPSDGRYDVESQVRTTIALIEGRGYGPVHLFGNSLGGAVATQVAADRPDLVTALTLISPALPDLRPRLAAAQLLVPLLPGLGPALMRRTATMSAEELAWQNLEGLYGDPARIHPRRLRDIADEIRGMARSPHAQRAYQGALRGIVMLSLNRGSGGLWRRARQVSVPTLVIYGGADRFISTRMAARTARSFRHCRVVLLSDIGHVAHLEAPHVVADAVRALLPQAADEEG